MTTSFELFPKLIKESGYTLSSAESCTGGLIGHLITNIPGSSMFFPGGIVAYSNEIKSALLDVSPELLKQHGAVSEEVAAAMATGVNKRMKTDIGVSTTGVAGPGGGTPEKPVGMVFIGLAFRDRVIVEKYHWPFNRLENKESSAEQALQMIVDHILQVRGT